MTKLSITYQLTSALNPRANNPRTHSPKQVAQLVRCMKRYGFTNPILVDDTNGIIAGHGRVMAAEELGMTEVPTVRLSGMSEAEIRAYVIADNKLAENAGWDEKLLGLELQYLSELDIDFDVSITGFELPEIDAFIDKLSLDDKENPADEAMEVMPEEAVTQTGDIWRIGNHRLICGDSTKEETYQLLLGGERAQMVFCDPPYNVAINGNVSGLGKIQHREFAMASGEMTQEEFTQFLIVVFSLLAKYSVDGSIHFQCMDFRHMIEMLTAGNTAYTELKNLCVWVKNNGGMGALYRSKHELVFVFKSGTEPHINNVELGKHGRYRTNVWEYAGVNSRALKHGIIELPKPKQGGGVVIIPRMGGIPKGMERFLTARFGIPKDGKWLPEEIEAVRPHFEEQEAHDEEALRQRYRDEFASRKHYDRK